MSNKIITTAISALLTMGVTGVNTPTFAETTTMHEPVEQLNMSDMLTIEGMERCYGVAKAGQNDCSARAHKCGGESQVDGDKAEWINVPTGLCNKIVGGSTKEPSKV